MEPRRSRSTTEHKQPVSKTKMKPPPNNIKIWDRTQGKLTTPKTPQTPAPSYLIQRSKPFFIQCPQQPSQPKPLPPPLLNERKLRSVPLTPTRVRQAQQQQRNSNAHPSVDARRFMLDSGERRLQRSARSFQLRLRSIVLQGVDSCAEH